MADETQTPAHSVRLAWIRHEIRNPLNVIVGSLRLLELSGLTAKQQKHVAMARGAADAIASLLANLENTFGEPSVALDTAIALHALGGVSFLTKPYEREQLLAAIHAARPDARALRILAADDAPEASLLLQALLEGSGHVLEIVQDGEAAVKRARTREFDVILMDLEMPGVTGADAAGRIRDDETRAERPHVPIVIISGHELGAGLESAETADTADDEVRPDPEIAPLVPEFLANRRADLPTLRAAIDAADWDTIRAMGHKIKGTGRGYGFPRISDIGRELEAGAAAQDAAALREAVDALERYLERVRVL